jgi:translocation and assembly module TamB
VVTLEGKAIGVPSLALNLAGNEQGWQAGLDLEVAGGGTLRGSFAAAGPARLALPEAGEVQAAGAGFDVALLRPWLPEALRLEGLLTGRATGTLTAGRRLEMTGEAALGGGKVRWQAGGDILAADLQRAQWSWAWGGELGGDGGGIAAGRLTVAGRIGAAGAVTLDGRAIGVPSLALNIEGNERGWQAGLDLELDGGGALSGSFAAGGPARLALPEAGEMRASWSGLDLALLRPWLPEDIVLEGALAGRATGRLQPGRRIALAGDAALSGGRVRWRGPEGEIGAALSSAALAWDWQGEALSGEMTLALAEHGQLRGRFRLPIPARIPLAVETGGALQGSLTGQVREEGLLTALFPGWLQESRGEIDVDLRLDGTWEDPRFAGQLRLTGAGAYLPTAGIRLKDLQLTLNLEKDLVRIDAFRVASGPGQLTGEARVRFAGWRVTGYEGRIDGERFQSVFLPELQLLTAPRLTFSGTPEKVIVRGEVNLPEMLILGPPVREVVQPSRDVILEGVPKSAARPPPLALDVQVRVTLGERVLVKVAGIDAQLAGAVDLQFEDPERITSRGEIRVVRGHYRTYGVDLAIVRGRLFYAGVPLNQPTLDALALRTVGDVRAGVLVRGNLAAPSVKLYSEPAMQDVDVLAYIVFGRPLSGGGEQASMMIQAAGLLLSKGQSVVLQEQIKDRLGLSTLEIQTAAAESPGRAGYPAIPTTPADVAPGAAGTGVTDTVLTVGKYLTPQLYFSYGRSLFTGGNLFRLRYDLTPQWQIETQTGAASGVDLYYKIQFQ